jgi:hypothetical protein
MPRRRPDKEDALLMEQKQHAKGPGEGRTRGRTAEQNGIKDIGEGRTSGQIYVYIIMILTSCCEKNLISNI